jgi:hypothetical protein
MSAYPFRETAQSLAVGCIEVGDEELARRGDPLPKGKIVAARDKRLNPHRELAPSSGHKDVGVHQKVFEMGQIVDGLKMSSIPVFER